MESRYVITFDYIGRLSSTSAGYLDIAGNIILYIIHVIIIIASLNKYNISLCARERIESAY